MPKYMSNLEARQVPIRNDTVSLPCMLRHPGYAKKFTKPSLGDAMPPTCIHDWMRNVGTILERNVAVIV